MESAVNKSTLICLLVTLTFRAKSLLRTQVLSLERSKAKNRGECRQVSSKVLYLIALFSQSKVFTTLRYFYKKVQRLEIVESAVENVLRSVYSYYRPPAPTSS